MRYWLDLFTPETWGRFQGHGSNVSGFPVTMRNQTREIAVGDLLVCYVVRVSRFCGLLRIDSGMFEDHTPIFTESDDPFPIRFRVTPLVVLEMQHAVPVLDPSVWNALALTRGRARGRGWGMVFRRSLREFERSDGEF